MEGERERWMGRHIWTVRSVWLQESRPVVVSPRAQSMLAEAEGGAGQLLQLKRHGGRAERHDLQTVRLCSCCWWGSCLFEESRKLCNVFNERRCRVQIL